ncbi:MAG: hypothetical protein CSA45_02760 [Gammaproteobacteria bacterium]|nr:MAG: hypothetical protein CSA45_02760 [Gammaproteobacteria bacterium]
MDRYDFENIAALTITILLFGVFVAGSAYYLFNVYQTTDNSILVGVTLGLVFTFASLAAWLSMIIAHLISWTISDFVASCH